MNCAREKFAPSLERATSLHGGKLRHTPDARAAIPPRQIQLLALVLYLGAPMFSLATDPPSGDRLPVPKSYAQSKAEKAIGDRYKSEFALRTPPDQLALARTLREKALTETDPPVIFVMLREARELFIDGGDLDSAFAAIDEMGKTFAINVRDMKGGALSISMDKSPLPPAELAEAYVKIIDKELDDHDDVDLAHKAWSLADLCARKARDPALTARVNGKGTEVHRANKEFNDAVAAARKLTARPEDVDANLVVGRHQCFYAGEWEAGLALLAKGSSLQLKELAAKELAPPSDPSGMAALAGEWWDLPEKPTGVPQAKARKRAVYWYAKALSGLPPEQRAVAEQRIAQAGQEGRQ